MNTLLVEAIFSVVYANTKSIKCILLTTLAVANLPDGVSVFTYYRVCPKPYRIDNNMMCVFISI